MGLLRNDFALGSKPMPAVLDNNLTAIRLNYKPLANLAANDIVELGYLPAGARLVDFTLDNDALTGGAVSIGLLNAGKTDIDTVASGGAAWLPAQSIAAAGAVRADSAALRYMTKVPKADVNRPLGLKVTAATTAFTGLEVGVTIYYRQEY